MDIHHPPPPTGRQILALSKLKAFADDKLNNTQKRQSIRSIIYRVGNKPLLLHLLLLLQLQLPPCLCWSFSNFDFSLFSPRYRSSSFCYSRSATSFCYLLQLLHSFLFFTNFSTTASTAVVSRFLIKLFPTFTRPSSISLLLLTHYQMTNFRLFQTERVCRQQFQI